MYQEFTNSKTITDRSGTMESGDHLKNVASPKSHKSRVNKKMIF